MTILTTGKTRMVDILGHKTQREWAGKHCSFAAHHRNLAKANVAMLALTSRSIRGIHQG